MAAELYQAKASAASHIPEVDDPTGHHINGRSQTILHAPVGAVPNGPGPDHSDESGLVPLNIAIVGAGIGGLAAATGLRRNGHNVSVSFTQCSIYSTLTSRVALRTIEICK
jgi:hypothetical protein